MDAFFERSDDDRFRSTELTRGPWDRDSQHAGPPSALLGTAMQDALGQPLARITVEILRPVPIADLTVRADVVRPGRSVRLAEGTLSDDVGPVLLARGWAIRETDLDIDPPGDEPWPSPEEAGEGAFFPVPWDEGYHTAMEVRFLDGAFTQIGPARAWMRPRVSLISGQELTPLQRVLLAADSGNGLSSALDFSRYLFINTDLTVHLHRHPAGEWVGFDARTVVQPHGVGLATTTIRDRQGEIGRGLQSLLIGERPPQRSAE